MKKLVAAVAVLAVVVLGLPLLVAGITNRAAALLARSTDCGTTTTISTTAGAGGGSVVWPVPGRQTGTYPGHDGVDINRGSGNQDLGDPIVAAASGTVDYVGTGHGYGQAIFIATDYGVTTIYGHTSRTVVTAGQRVTAGQLIGNVGNTGHSTAAHLHFGVKPGLTYQAAIDFLHQTGTAASTTQTSTQPTVQPTAPAVGQPVVQPVVQPTGRWSTEQLGIARTAVAVGKAHSIPEQGWVVAIAAGLVESGLRNLDYGDRDSLGWLQQRPSAGWGTVTQIRDPALAAAAFYGVATHTNNRGLVDVYNWQTKPVGVVAQSIQVSAFPTRYAAREADARAIVTQLSGTTPAAAAVPCTGTGDVSGVLRLVAVLNPQGAGNWQGAVHAGPYWYVAHATAGDRTQVFHRLNSAGVELDQMTAVGFAHATSFAAVGNTLYATDAHNNVVTFRYRPGATIRAGTPTGWHGYISLDPTGTTVVIRNGNHYRAYNTTTHQPVGVEIRTEPGPRQGFSISGTTVFVLTGVTNQPARVDSYSTTTGARTGSRDITSLGAAQAGSHREPEGMYGAMVGIKTDTGDRRRLRVYAFTAAGSTSTAVGGYRTVDSVRIPIPAGPAGTAISYALDQVGKPYVWGAHGPNSFDCSGLTGQAWAHAGKTIPQQTDAQAAALTHVPLNQARPGDILYAPGHVQIFLGVINDKWTVVEAANPRAGIRIDRTHWMKPDAVLRP